jgi:hypothetical protein
MIDRLESIGIYDESLIVVVADHGVSFYPDSQRRDAPPFTVLDRDVLPVPLFIKFPFQKEGKISDENVETIDILPTIVDVLDAETGLIMDGRSLLSEQAPRPQKLAFHAYKDFLQYKSDPGGEAKYETLEWKLQNFKPSTGVDGLFRIGRHSGLVGLQISDLRVSEVGDVDVKLDRPELYADVNPDSGFIPSQVSGTIQSAGPNLNPDLAIVINGSIQAVTEMNTGSENTYRFSAMVPEQSFKNGANSVSVFLISTDLDGNIELLAGHKQPEQFSTESDLRAWVLAEGEIVGGEKQIPIKPEKFEGMLEYARVDGGTIEFFGWAMDVWARDAVDKIVIFENGQYVYSNVTGMPRGEGALYDASNVILLGFQFIVPESLFQTPGKSDIRLFAISKHGYAAELQYFDGYAWADRSR